MKKNLLLLCFLGTGLSSLAQPCSNLFFSEYLEGTSNNKAIEVVNPTTSTINLADYKIYRYNNGSAIASDSLQLVGTLAPGDVYVAGNPSAVAAILGVSDTLHTITFFNGDDVLMLRQTSTQDTLDIFGIIGVDPGTNWPVGTGATSEFTLVRMASITEGTTDWSVSSTQWDVFPSNTFDSLGHHFFIPCCTANTGSASPVACFSYTSPSGLYTWTSSGTYTDTLTNAGGCDSVITLNLTINTVNTGISASGLMATATATGAAYQWVDCNAAFAIIGGETNQSYTATANGDYAVIVTESGCTDTTACVSIIGTGLSSIEQETRLQLYPNPVANNLTLVAPMAGTLVITDLGGKTVLTRNLVAGENTININHLAPGIYQLGLSGTAYRAKLVKQ